MLVLRIIENTQAVSARNSFMGVETRNVILVWLEILIFISFFITLALNFNIIQHYGTSIIGRPFIYIMFGTIFLAFTRIYIILYNFFLYDLEESTLQFGWHIIFYTGMIAFLLSINSLDKRRFGVPLHGFNRRDLTIIIGLTFINIVAYVITITGNKIFAKNFDNSFLDIFGSVHFIAFLLAGYLTIKLLNIRSTSTEDDLGRLIVSFIPSFLVFLSLMSLNHLWELITENWDLIELDYNVVETVEQMFWLPGFIATAYGFRQVQMVMNNSIIIEEEELMSKIFEECTPLMRDLLQILSHHVGSSAMSIAIQSSSDMGLTFDKIEPVHIQDFSKVIQNNTKELIGEFPSKFLEEAIKLVSTIYNTNNSSYN